MNKYLIIYICGVILSIIFAYIQLSLGINEYIVFWSTIIFSFIIGYIGNILINRSQR